MRKYITIITAMRFSITVSNIINTRLWQYNLMRKYGKMGVKYGNGHGYHNKQFQWKNRNQKGLIFEKSKKVKTKKKPKTKKK